MCVSSPFHLGIYFNFLSYSTLCVYTEISEVNKLKNKRMFFNSVGDGVRKTKLRLFPTDKKLRLNYSKFYCPEEK
jgi:hypothetical protein